MFGHWELIVLLVVVLLIFGPSQLPKLAKGIGKSIQSFKSGIKDAEDEQKSAPQLAAGEEKKELPDKAKNDG
jgi:sec-independent protein translocase protein TatA